MDKQSPPPKDSKPKPKASPNVMGGKNSRNASAMEAAGMKAGGTVKKPGKGRYC
jgi:hypothetical protein